MKKTILATIAIALGVVVLCYIVVAHSHTLVRVGLSVPNQLVAQRIITFVVFASLVAMKADADKLQAENSWCGFFVEMDDEGTVTQIQ